MKYFLYLTVILLFAQLSSAQIKVDEYEKTDSDSESIRVFDFITSLKKESESKGLIVVYSGEKETGLVNSLRHIEGIKRYFSDYDLFPLESISFKLVRDKKPLQKEFWIYRKDEKLPESELTDINLDNLKAKYLFASICAICEPAERRLSTDYVGFDLYAKLLKRYPAYKSSIIIQPVISTGGSYREALYYASEYRKILTNNYQINNKRVSIRIFKPVKNNVSGVDVARFYIIPG